MKKKSIGINAFMNIINTILKMLFPLVTFPYVSRILGVDNIGKVNYANSIVSYFVLIAGLGIASYAIREGAKIRNDKIEFSNFASEIFSINLISTIVAYVLLLICICLIPELRNYWRLLLLYSSQIIFITLGIDWINSAFEEFSYITLRSCLFQVISLILIFSLIKSSRDYYIYAGILVFSSVGANILNFFHVRKFCKIKIIFNKSIFVHLRSVMYIFFACIASAVYTSLDMTMLGSLKGEYDVGIYSAAIKVYNVLKQVLFAVIVVFEPRLSFYAKSRMKDDIYRIWMKKLANLLIILVIPMTIGIMCISDKIIIVLAGTEYIEAVNILNVLALSVIFSTFSYFAIHAILLPLGYEKYIGKATLAGAIINFILNLILIRSLSGIGAAIATLCAEIAVMIVALYSVRKEEKLRFNIKSLISACFGGIGIVVTTQLWNEFGLNMISELIGAIGCSVLVYFTILLIMKEENVVTGVYTIAQKIVVKKKNVDVNQK